MIEAEAPDVREDEVVVECDLDATPEKVWRALTAPELVQEWLGVPTYDAAAETEPSYEIVEAKPFSRLRYAWRDHQTTEPDTIVTFDLAPLPGGGTWFRLTHGITSSGRAPMAAANSNAPPLALAA